MQTGPKPKEFLYHQIPPDSNKFDNIAVSLVLLTLAHQLEQLIFSLVLWHVLHVLTEAPAFQLVYYHYVYYPCSSSLLTHFFIYIRDVNILVLNLLVVRFWS